jgi:hypothetical protein
MVTVLRTVTMSPAKGGTRVRRMVEAMQPPVGVAWNGGPEMFAVVTRPVCENVIVTTATPLGSPSLRQLDACSADISSALRAAATSNGSVPTGPRGSTTVLVVAAGAGSGAASGLVGAAGWSSVGLESRAGFSAWVFADFSLGVTAAGLGVAAAGLGVAAAGLGVPAAGLGVRASAAGFSAGTLVAVSAV